MTFVLTLLLTFVFVVVALLGFWKLGPPVYHLERINIIALLELITSGRATESDWNVFCAHAIRHEPELEACQHRCLEIAEREYVGGPGYLFTRRGLDELEEILEELKARERKEGGESVPEQKR